MAEPPYQAPLVDASGRVTPGPWRGFFSALAHALVAGGPGASSSAGLALSGAGLEADPVAAVIGELYSMIPPATPAPSFTPGSVIFAGSTGGLSQNNASFFWDNTNGALGLGNAAPLSNLQVNGNLLVGVGLPVSYQTTINILGGISAADVTITVASTTGFPFAGTIRCQLELITYTGKTPTTFTGCTRGRYLTTAATHANGQIVALMPIVLAENETSGNSILFGPGQLYVGHTGALNEIGSGSQLASFKVGANFSVGGTNGVAIQDAGATGMAFMVFDGTNAVFGTRTNTSISFRTNNTMRASVTQGQNICIDSAIGDPASGSKCLILGDGTAPSGLASNTCIFYGNDVAGTVNGFGINEAGEVTQITGDMTLPTSRILRFGGTSATEVALKRSSTALEVRLADDSAYAELRALRAVVDAADRLGFFGRSRVTSPADGNLLLTDDAAATFDRLMFGGSSSSFPALKRAAAVLEAKLADDSAYTDLRAFALRITDGAFLVRAEAALADGVGAALGTLTTAPTAGDPTKWIPIDDNGTTRYVPAW